MPRPYSPPSLVFDAIGPGDVDFLYLDLMDWVYTGETVTLTGITVEPPCDGSPTPTIDQTGVDTSTITVGSGVASYVSTGPRLRGRISGCNSGVNYDVVFQWSTSSGRSKSVTTILPGRAT